MTRIQLRRDIASEWLKYNPILAAGEAGYEIDTGKHKMGDGVTRWVDLSYFIPEVDIDIKLADITGEELPELTILFENGLY